MYTKQKQRKNWPIIILTLIALLLVFWALFGRNIFSGLYSVNTSTQSEEAIEIKTYKVEVGWGYDIYANGSLLIHQTSIPTLPGNDGFENEADAQKAAEIVVGKIKNNIMPPSLSEDELKSLGITAKE